MASFEDHDERPPSTTAPHPSAFVAVGLGALVLGGLGIFLTLRGTPPPPPDIANDPRLVAGREVYLARCAGCHGQEGRGDGPLAKGLQGPPVGDLTDGRWKHGEAPADVLRVIREGVPNTTMPGWGRVLGQEEVDDVTKYVLHLAGRPKS